MSPTEKQQQQPIRTCKFYGSNFRNPRVYPPRRKTILIDPAESPFSIDDNTKSKHGAAKWTVEGLGSKRFRLHGKVEGNLNRLRMEKDDDEDDVTISQCKDTPSVSSSSKSKTSLKREVKAPCVGTKRSRYASLIDEEEED